MLQLKCAETTLGQRQFQFSLQVQAAETIAVVGTSGAGKSTLLNLIAGFLPVSRGDIRWRENSIISHSPQQRPVTSLFQANNLFEHLTVEKNVALGIHPGLSISSQQWKTVAESLANVGLRGMGKRMPESLSGGEQQRVGLARCLVRQQPILLLDEPYSALDANTRNNMLALTREICHQQQLCTIVVSHNPDDAKALDAQVFAIQKDRLTVH